MFKSKRLKRQLKKAKESKIQEIRNRNFELAATYLDEEKEILQELKNSKQESIFLKLLKSLFYKHKSEYLYGIYLQEKESDLPIYLPFYYFSRELNHYLECFFAEHPAFKFDWIEQPQKRKNMVKEVTEYYFITEILDHFSRWWRNSGKDNCKYELTKNDIEDIIQSNLFLKLFTMPIKYRNAFKEFKPEPLNNVIVLKDENNNPIGYYHRFQYKFPFKLKLKKEGDDYVISTPFVKLKFHVNCCGEERLLKDFCQIVYGFKKDKVPRIDVFIDIYIKRFAFIYPRNWKYLKTICSLTERLKDSFSSDYFFNTFSWHNIYIQSRIIENIIGTKKDSSN